MSGILGDPLSLWRTRAGHVWVSTGLGMWEWTESQWIPREALSPNERSGSLVIEGRSGLGFIFVGADPRGLFRFREGAPMVEESGEGDNTLWAGDVSDGDLAILAYETGDLRAWVDGRWRSVTLPPSRASGVRFVHFSPSGDIWFGTNRGLHLYMRSRRRWSVTRRPFPAATNRVNGILIGRDNTVWLATGGGILHHVPPAPARWIRST